MPNLEPLIFKGFFVSYSFGTFFIIDTARKSLLKKRFQEVTKRFEIVELEL